MTRHIPTPVQSTIETPATGSVTLRRWSVAELIARANAWPRATA